MSKPIPKVKQNPLEIARFNYEMTRNYLNPLMRYMQQPEYNEIFRLGTIDDAVYVVFMPEHVRDVLIKNAKRVKKGGDYTDSQRGLARLLGNGLITSEGDFWKRQRKMVSPAFHAQRVGNYAEMMVRLTDEAITGWQDDQQRDIAQDMSEITLDIISWTLMHDAPRENATVIFEALEKLQRVGIGDNVVPSFAAGWWWSQADAPSRAMDNIIYPMIEERRKDNKDHGDLLSMLMLAEDDDGQHMTDEEIRDEVVTLFMAGHETTANTLNWTFYLLSEHPEIEAKLHAELDSVLDGRLPTLADLRQLPYTTQIIKETMRLYPAAPGISRTTLEPIEVGEYSIPADQRIYIQSYMTHRHPDVWEQPNVFDPERFSAENEPNIDKWAYYPFGGGQRVCIGNSFSMMEAPLVLATIASRYKLRLVPGFKVEAEAAITLYPRHGLQMNVQQRERVAASQPQMT